MSHRKRLSLGLATLCLALSLWTVTQEVISEYNAEARVEQSDRKSIAENGATFSHDWDWDIDYRGRKRHLILLLLIGSFLLSISPRTAWFALLAYGLTFPLVYQWIVVTVRDLSLNSSYMADSPFLLRIATPFEWALFMSIAITFGVSIFLLVNSTPSRGFQPNS